MIIVITSVIILLCLIGAAAAFLLSDSDGKGTRWTAAEERLPSQRPYSHVEQGPDSLYPLSRGNVINEKDDIREED